MSMNQGHFTTKILMRVGKKMLDSGFIEEVSIQKSNFPVYWEVYEWNNTIGVEANANQLVQDVINQSKKMEAESRLKEQKSLWMQGVDQIYSIPPNYFKMVLLMAGEEDRFYYAVAALKQQNRILGHA